MKIVTGDTVYILTGKQRGQKGRVLRALPSANKVVVEGINQVTKHIKKTPQRKGEKVVFEKPIDVSNVALMEKEKPVRVGYTRDAKGKKQRIARKTGTVIPYPKS